MLYKDVDGKRVKYYCVCVCVSSQSPSRTSDSSRLVRAPSSSLGFFRMLLVLQTTYCRAPYTENAGLADDDGHVDKTKKKVKRYMLLFALRIKGNRCIHENEYNHTVDQQKNIFTV